MNRLIKRFVGCAAACTAALAATPAAAEKIVYLKAQAYCEHATTGANTGTPSGTPSACPAGSVAMWGYALGDSEAAALAATPVAPGPTIEVPPGDPDLRVVLLNRLPGGVPTSFVLHGARPTTATGAAQAMTPVLTLDSTGAVCATTSFDCRVRSFTREAANGGSQTYYYWGLKPGTYLYQSGTLPQIQVQMGLAGALMRDDGVAGVAYGPTTTQPNALGYDNVAVAVYSEVDPVMHAAVQAGTYAGSTIGYNPSAMHLTINGTRFGDVGTQALPVGADRHVLLRLVNAGLQTRVPTLTEGVFNVAAEDASRYPYARLQSSILLPAAKTVDALYIVPSVTAASADPAVQSDARQATALYDNRMGLDNAVGGAAHDTGMLARVYIDPNVQDIVFAINPCTAGGTQDAAYGCAAAGAFGATPLPAGLTWSLDAAPAGMSIDALTGAIAWTPSNSQAQNTANGALVNTAIVKASTGTGTASSIGRFTFQVAVTNVNDAPTATADAYAVCAGSRVYAGTTCTASTAFGSVLANDLDIDGDTLALQLPGPTITTTLGNTVTMAPDGSFTVVAAVPAAGQPDLADSFAYTIGDNPVYVPTIGGALTANGSVALTIRANRAPTAVNDGSYTNVLNNSPIATVRRNASGTANSVVINVVANDTDGDGAVVPASVSIVPGSLVWLAGLGGIGSVTALGDGTVRYTAGSGVGYLRFRYTVRDDRNDVSGQGDVIVRVTL